MNDNLMHSSKSLIAQATKLKTKKQSTKFVNSIKNADNAVDLNFYYSTNNKSLPGMTLEETKTLLQQKVDEDKRRLDYELERMRQEDKESRRKVTVGVIVFGLLVLVITVLPYIMDFSTSTVIDLGQG